jgi:UPF0176 protein
LLFFYNPLENQRFHLMREIFNAAAYRFGEVKDLPGLRTKLRVTCRNLGLKGTILLSTEGINLSVAGSRKSISQLLRQLDSIPGMENITAKYSRCTEQPFSRMLVKLKKEIIAFGVEGIDPGTNPSPKLQPKELKKWLDEGRPVTLLDTRNDYEVKLGTFKGALRSEIDHFKEFPDAVRRLPDSLKNEPIVTFCTGGIRCEKAGPFMEREGFRNIYQLDGGILKYFEECGDAHYDGECFVFDQRVGVDGDLRETGSVLCFNCQIPLTTEEQRHPFYVANVSCPHCYRTPSFKQKTLVAERQNALIRATRPLPESRKNLDGRPLTIPPEFAGSSLIDFLSATLVSISRAEWEAECGAGRVVNSEFETLPASHQVEKSERCLHLYPQQIEPDINTDIRFIHEDDAIVVLEKPAPLPMCPTGLFKRNTLQFILNVIYQPFRLRPAYVLDSDATGLCVFAKTRQIAGHLKPQFDHREITATIRCRVDANLGDTTNSSETDVGQIEINTFVESAAVQGSEVEVKSNFIDLSVIRDWLKNQFSRAGCSTNPALHLCRLKIVHPFTHKEMIFDPERPE